MLKRFASSIRKSFVLTSAGIIAGTFALAFVLSAFLPDTFASGNNQAFDRFIRLRYRLQGKQAVSPYLIHVVVNDTTHRVLDLPSWDRAVFGQVIAILQDTPVSLIACDVFFKDEGIPEHDRPLLQAVDKSRAVIFPILVYPDDYFASFEAAGAMAFNHESVEQYVLHPKIENRGSPPTAQVAIPPFPALSARSLGLGHINYSPDRDGKCRRVPLLFRFKTGYIPSFSLKIILEYFDVEPENIEVSFGKHITLRNARVREDVTKDVVIPIDSQGRIIINFVAPWEDSFLNFPVHKLLTAQDDDAAKTHLFDLMEGSVVVISDISTTNRDYGPGIFESVYPLSGIHVNIVNSILTENFLTDQQPVLRVVSALVFAALLWLISVRFRSLAFSLGCILLYGLYIVFCAWLLIDFHQAPKIVAPSLGFLFVLISTNVYRIFIVEREKSVYKVQSEANQKLEGVNRELIQQKRDLEVANHKLAELDRFKTRFVQNITHELRTPLTMIIEPLETLWNYGREELSDMAATNLSFVRENADKLLRLVNQFLDLSKYEAGKVRLRASRSDIVKYVRGFVRKFVSIAEHRKVELRFLSSADSLPCYFDPDKLDKILTNLLSNSLKATEANDLIEVKLEATGNVPELLHRRIDGRIPLEEMLRIHIRDTGRGIPAKDVPHILERFHQVDQEHGGSGVGLSLVKECVDIQHGQISVESKLGTGTLFTVHLPWAREHYSPDELDDIRVPGRFEDPGTPADFPKTHRFDSSGSGLPDAAKTRRPSRNDFAGSVPGETLRRIWGKYPENPILIVDDEVDLLESHRVQLTANGIDNLILCSAGGDVLQALHDQEITAVLLDLSLPDISGKKLLAEIKENYPGIHVLVITGVQDVDVAVDCIKVGAFDYMVKPVQLSRLLSQINHCIDKKNLEKQIDVLTRKIQSTELKNPEAFAEIVTQSETMLSKFRYVEAVAESHNPVLVTGESGVGKELVARVIHRLSNRTGKFVCENIAGLDDTMVSDTLFGHAKGAFTDAEGNRRGLVEDAAGGTLFLDEIGDMSINSQVKLLRFIEQGEYRPLGTDKVKMSDARIIIATNANLKQKLDSGTFRKDLFYRLTHQIEIPPLRNRLEDLPCLIDHFVSQTAEALQRKPPSVPHDLIRLLKTYDFPGNIRELKNMIENALSRSSSRSLSLSYFREYLQSNGSGNAEQSSVGGLRANHITLPERFPKLKELEEYVVSEALLRSKGNQNIAARLLGLSPSALSRRIKKIGGRGEG